MNRLFRVLTLATLLGLSAFGIVSSSACVCAVECIAPLDFSMPVVVSDPFTTILEHETTTTGTATDPTTFTFVYDSKCWIFTPRPLIAHTFEHQHEIDRYHRNGSKLDKMKQINKAISIGIPKQTAFEYMYHGLGDVVRTMTKSIYRQKRDATLTLKSNQDQPFIIKGETIGRRVDIVALYEEIYHQYYQRDKIVIDIPTILDYPTITAKSLKSRTALRGGFSTNIASSSPARKHNVKKSLLSINGLRVQPNEKISFNTVVGKRTEQNGYKSAKIIIDGEFVEGTGGGVCQTSTTLYNALLLSGIDVLSVHKHSQRVSYVPVGLDAMVNYGSSDLVFVNNTAHDIYIISRYTDSKITVNIYGDALESGVRYQTVSETEEILQAGAMDILIDTEGKYADKVKYDDESFILKPQKSGIIAKSYLCKYQNGALVDKKFLRRETYKAQNGVKVFGAVPSNERVNDSTTA